MYMTNRPILLYCKLCQSFTLHNINIYCIYACKLVQIISNHNNSNKLAVFIVLHHVTSGMPDLRLHQAQRSVHRAGQQPAVQYAAMKMEPTQSLKYIHPTTAPLHWYCLFLLDIYCLNLPQQQKHPNIETYHIKIVFRRLLQSFTFLENRPNAKSRSMSLAERYVQIKSYRAAKTLQSSRLSNHQLLGNAYKRTTLLRCKCCLNWI